MATKARTELDLGEILEKLRELSSREDALRMQVRQLSEERREVSAKLARMEETLEASTLNGLRPPPEELAKQAAELEKKLHQLNDQLARIDEELGEIGHERISLLKKSLPVAWRQVQEARKKAYDPELRREALEQVANALEPFVEAQAELQEAEGVLGMLLRHAGRVDPRAPSLLRSTLTERHGPMLDPPSRDRTWRAIRRIATLTEEAR